MDVSVATRSAATTLWAEASGRPCKAHTTEQGGPDEWAWLAQQLPKVGPSLAGLAGRVEMAYVLDRLRDPRRFLPETRMPRLFGLHEHLDPESRMLAERLEAVAGCKRGGKWRECK